MLDGPAGDWEGTGGSRFKSSTVKYPVKITIKGTQKKQHTESYRIPIAQLQSAPLTVNFYSVIVTTLTALTTSLLREVSRKPSS